MSELIPQLVEWHTFLARPVPRAGSTWDTNMKTQSSPGRILAG